MTTRSVLTSHCRQARRAARLCAFVLCSLLAQSALADVGLTPMHMDVVAPPGGEAVAAQFTVINTSEEPRTVRFTVEDFTVGDHGALLFRHELESHGVPLESLERHAGASYVHAVEESVDLAPFEERMVTFEVTLPLDAHGQYFAMVRADAGVVVPQVVRGAPHNLRVRLQVGAFLFITAGWLSERARADGDLTSVRRATPARYEVDVADLRVEFPAPADERQTLRVVAEIESRSTVYYIGDMAAVILNSESRRIVERIRFSQGVKLVLPNSRRVYVGEVRSRLDPGTYRIRFNVDGDAPQLRDSRATSVELMESVIGLGEAVGAMRVLDVTPADRISLGPGTGRVEQRVRVYNNTDDAVRVETQVNAPDDVIPRLRVSPRRFGIPPGGVRSVRVAVRTGPGHDGGVAELAIVPVTRGGVAFPEEETRRLDLRVAPGIPRPNAVSSRPGSAR